MNVEFRFLLVATLPSRRSYFCSLPLHASSEAR